MLRASMLLAVFVTTAKAASHDYPLLPAPLPAVKTSDDFWSPRLETNRTVTIPHVLRELEKRGSLDGFALLAGRNVGKYRGYMWGDSDVYKTLEAVAYSLQMHPDPALQQRLEQIVSDIVAAQADDGYLMPHIQLAEPNYAHFSEATTRTCETYSMGHMIEAAVAHHQATGKRHFLDAAIKAADLISREYRPGRNEKPSGHPGIELALIKLYRATGEDKYLTLTHFLVEQARRHGTLWSGPPFLGHDQAIGHAVAATYLYSGAADVAVLSDDDDLLRLLESKWKNVVGRKMYLTGGIGVRTHGEAFGEDYELPNQHAYCETCAAIAHALWNHRLFLAHGDAQYVDVLERIIYNGFLSGVSLSGDRFFYPNPLESRGGYQRSPWFGCACCPVNVVRFFPTIPTFLYATRGRALYVNLFACSNASLQVGGMPVTVRQETRYPWDGHVKIAVDPQDDVSFTLAVRIPGWTRNQPVPSDLYRYDDTENPTVSLAVNGEAEPLKLKKGYAQVARKWQRGDVVTLQMSMAVRRVVANDAVSADVDCFAVERGPVVYCAEGVDNDGVVWSKVPGSQVKFAVKERPDLLGGVMTVQMQPLKEGEAFALTPYYAWANRGANEMTVWFRTKLPRWGASYCWLRDSVEACFDGKVPERSNDLSVPRLTWWAHKGTAEWVERRFDDSRKVSAVAVYWFDDTGSGGCRVPQSWQLSYKDGNRWKPVTGASAYGIQLDQFNRVTFDPVDTTALRIDVQLQPKWSGGILEWRME